MKVQDHVDIHNLPLLILSNREFFQLYLIQKKGFKTALSWLFQDLVIMKFLTLISTDLTQERLLEQDLG